MKNQTIVVASDEQLKDPQYYLELWRAVRAADIPRRDWLDAIADAFRDFEGEILNPDGSASSTALSGAFLCTGAQGSKYRVPVARKCAV